MCSLSCPRMSDNDSQNPSEAQGYDSGDSSYSVTSSEVDIGDQNDVMEFGPDEPLVIERSEEAVVRHETSSRTIDGLIEVGSSSSELPVEFRNLI